MTMRKLMVCLAALAAATVLGTSGPAADRETPELPFEEYGELEGARYEILIPEGWNGGLVMYAHGYIDPNQPYVFKPERPRVAEFINLYAHEKGYATARSAYSRNGMNWLPAADETVALRDHFEERFGLDGPVILTGLHGGGQIVRYVAERHPTSFDGIISFAGSAGPMLTTYRGMVEQRALFDYLFPGLPGSAVDYEGEAGAWLGTRATELMKAGDPVKVVDYLRISELDTVEEAGYQLGVFAWNLRDVLRWVTDGENPFDTMGVVYSGSSDDAALNRGVERYKADPEAATIVRRRWDLTGRIERPMISLNSLDDPAVPPESARFYYDLVQLANRAPLYVQMWADWRGPGYSPRIVRTTFDLMEAWIENGTPPEPGEVVGR